MLRCHITGIVNIVITSASVKVDYDT